MKWIVYCTTCTENGKIYIGVHKTENPDTFDGYIGNGIKIGYFLKNPKTAFQYAVKKYGYAKFKRAILYVFDNETDAYNKEEEIVNIDFIKRKDNYNTCLGGCSHTQLKWIYRYDLNGNFIEEYYGIKDLADKMGCHYMCFRNACLEKRSFKNSFWSYEKFDKLDLLNYRKNKYSEIYQFDLNGNFIKVWENAEILRKELKITKSNLQTALDRKTSAKGYYFTKEKDQIYNILKSKEVYDNLPKLKCGEKRKIAQYDLNGNLIKIWDSVGECAKEYSKCRDVAKGILNKTKGYVFKYQ